MTESALKSKYRSIHIVAGSLTKGKGKHAKKNVVKVKCKSCGKVAAETCVGVFVRRSSALS